MKINKKAKRIIEKISVFVLVILMILGVVVSYLPYIFY